MNYKSSLLVVGILCAGISSITTLQADEKPAAKKRADIYDRSADGNKQIAEALAKAKAENKHVILKFGANWCGWCHKLSDLFKGDPAIAAVLKDNYILVLIDVDQVDGKQHNADVVAKYNEPTKHGLPVLVVLDSNGKQIHTQDTALLEDGPRHDPAKVMQFLEKWKPSRKNDV